MSAAPVRVVHCVYLDHVGTQIRQGPTGEGTCDTEAQVEHPNASQRMGQRSIGTRSDSRRGTWNARCRFGNDLAVC